MLGHNGYPAIVPGTDYAAVSICRNGEPVRTDVHHIGDDPLWDFLPEDGEDGPDNKAINAVHRSPYRKVAVLTREYGPHVAEPVEKADAAKDRKWLRWLASHWPQARSIDVVTAQGWPIMGFVRSSGQYRIKALPYG